MRAAHPLFASARHRDHKVLAARNVLLLKPLDEGAERNVSPVCERERDVIMPDLSLRVAPREPKDAMSRYPFHPQMRRVFDPYERAVVVASSERPAPDLLERDRVRMPPKRTSSQAKSTR